MNHQVLTSLDRVITELDAEAEPSEGIADAR